MNFLLKIRPNSLDCILRILLIRKFDHFHVLPFWKIDHLVGVTSFDHLAGQDTFDNFHVMQFDHLEHTQRRCVLYAGPSSIPTHGGSEFVAKTLKAQLQGKWLKGYTRLCNTVQIWPCRRYRASKVYNCTGLCNECQMRTNCSRHSVYPILNL